jgi:hypothetical protein
MLFKISIGKASNLYSNKFDELIGILNGVYETYEYKE